MREAIGNLGRSLSVARASVDYDPHLIALMFAHGHVAIKNNSKSRCYRVRNERVENFNHLVAQQSLVGAPNAGVSATRPGDVYLLCSEGLWRAVSSNVLQEVTYKSQHAQDACRALIGTAWANGGLDDLAVVVVRVVSTYSDSH